MISRKKGAAPAALSGSATLRTLALLGLAGSPALAGQYDVARALLDADAAAARRAWDALEPTDRGSLVPFGAELVPGRILALEGRLPEAREALARVAREGEMRDVAQHALWRLAVAAGDEEQELAALDALLPQVSLHPSRESWALRQAILGARHGRMATSEATLASLASSAREKRNRRDARAWQIEIALSRGTPEAYAAAIPMAVALLRDGSQDDAALRTVRALTSYEELRGVAVDAAASYVRGETFYQARDWNAALLHLGRAAGLTGVGPAGFPAPAAGEPAMVQAGGGSSRAEAAFLVGRVFYRMGDFASAIRAYDLAASMDEGVASGARSQRIVCLLRGGNPEEALQAIAAVPGKPTARMHELRAGALWALGRHADARAALSDARVLTRDAEGKREIDAREARLLLDAAAEPGEGADAWDAAADESLRALANGIGAEAGWARLVLAERREGTRPSDARELLGRALGGDPRGVWGELARAELATLGCEARDEVVAGVRSTAELLLAERAGDADPAVIAKERMLELCRRCPDVVESDGLDALRSVYLRFPRYRDGMDVAPVDVAAVGATDARHRRLLALGLASEAAFALLDDAEGELEPPMARAAILALGGETKRSLYLAEVRLSRIPADLVMPATSPTLRRLLYPMPAGVREAAAAAGIDARLVAAIAREESRFAADARSPAGARGIMQLVSDTARAVAAPAELADDDLYRAATSLSLGARYLRELRDRFGGSIPCTIAAYNGGPEAVAEWSGRSGRELLELHPEVEYAETRAYLAKVYLSYMRYCALYPDPEAPAPAWTELVRLPEPAPAVATL